jgi:hypothetical protein
MPLIVMVSPSTAKAVSQMLALTTPLSGGKKMIGEGLIPRQMTCWSQPGLGVQSPTCYFAERRIWLTFGLNHALYECTCDYHNCSKEHKRKFFF